MNFTRAKSLTRIFSTIGKKLIYVLTPTNQLCVKSNLDGYKRDTYNRNG
jgi:hypothetical protein